MADAAAAASAGSAGAAAGDAGAASAAAASAAAGAAGGAGAGAGAAAQQPGERPAWLPEKFWDGDGKAPRVEALAQSYGELEKRFKDTGAPPKDATGYKVELAKDEQFEFDATAATAFAATAHELGLTNAQYNRLVREHVKSVDALVTQADAKAVGEARATLLKMYGTEKSLAENVALAHKAFKAFADESEAARIHEIGNYPLAVALLAKIGRAMQEDVGILGASLPTTTDAEVADLMKDRKSAYWDGKHPQHKTAVEKVKNYHVQRAELEARKRNAA